MGLSVAHVDGRAVYLGLNGHEHAIQAGLPPAPQGRYWQRAVDTAWDAPGDAVLEENGAAIESQVGPAFSSCMLVRQPGSQTGMQHAWPQTCCPQGFHVICRSALGLCCQHMRFCLLSLTCLVLWVVRLIYYHLECIALEPACQASPTWLQACRAEHAMVLVCAG